MSSNHVNEPCFHYKRKLTYGLLDMAA